MSTGKVAERENAAETPGPFGSCPLPIFDHPQIVLGHGSGGKLSAELIEKVFVSRFRNSTLEKMDDQAVLEIGGVRLAFTTDSFVVTPIFFLPAADLARVVDSMASAAQSACVQLVAGDTKVVNRGKGDKVFITTTGIGLVDRGTQLSADHARPGDKILLSGFIGDHGITILSQRENLEFESALESDCAALNGLVDAMLDEAAGAMEGFRVMRDPTRGGVATVLNEIAGRSRVGMLLQEPEIPVRESVRGACEMLGLDPLYVANEGKLVAIVAPEIADRVLAAMRRHPLGAESRMIGEVVEQPAGMVLMKTSVGGTRVVDVLFGEQLPRIC
jgi:hydrogenase expression/formation protein HypE